MTDKEIIAEFVRARREVLLSMDLGRLKDFFEQNGGKGSLADATDEIWEMALHKARTGAKDLPFEERMASKRWLAERNLSSMDDGDLTQ